MLYCMTKHEKRVELLLQMIHVQQLIQNEHLKFMLKQNVGLHGSRIAKPEQAKEIEQMIADGSKEYHACLDSAGKRGVELRKEIEALGEGD